MPTPAVIREELVYRFPEEFGDPGNADLLDQCVNAARFLCGSAEAIEALRTINRRMTQRLASNADAVRHYLERLEAHYTHNPYSGEPKPARPEKVGGVGNILTWTLAQIESEAGFGTVFNGGGRSRVDVLLGPASPESFLKRIQEKRHFKDPMIGQEHGGHTHRLQWAMISLKAGALGIPSVPELYGHAGRVQRTYKGKLLSLWDALVDRDPTGGDINKFGVASDSTPAPDFRCPEKLTGYLVRDVPEGEKASLKLLIGYTRARWFKRKETFGLLAPDKQAAAMSAYATKKLPGAPEALASAIDRGFISFEQLL